MFKKNIKKKKFFSKLIIFTPNIENGGVEKNLFLLSNYLNKKISDITIVTFNSLDRKFFPKNINFVALKNVFNIKNRIFKNLICTILLIKIILLNRKIIILSFNSNLYATLLAKIFKIKIIVRINTSHKKWATNFIKKKIFKFFLKIPDVVIVNSNDLKKEIDMQFKINSTCIFNPLNKNEIIKIKKNNTNLFGGNKKTLKILFLGRLVDQKDPLTFVRSVAKIPENINYRAIIVGSGFLKKKILKYIKKKSLDKKLHQIDFTQKAMQYLSQCDLLILTSKFEGLPNVLLEAQFLKKYIISTNCPTGPREILLNGKAGELIETNNSKKLSEKIINFYYNKNKSIYKKRIDLGFKNLNRFDFQKNCKKYFNLIKNLS